MGPNCKHMNLCCENGYFNMTSMDICSLLGLASSGFEMYCSLWHFRVGFILPLEWSSTLVYIDGWSCGSGLQSWAMQCTMGIVVCNPQALKSHFLPFIGQEGPKLEIYDSILLHIW